MYIVKFPDFKIEAIRESAPALHRLFNEAVRSGNGPVVDAMAAVLDILARPIEYVPDEPVTIEMLQLVNSAALAGEV